MGFNKTLGSDTEIPVTPSDTLDDVVSSPVDPTVLAPSHHRGRYRGQGGFRHQADGLGDQVSRATAIRFDLPGPAYQDKTRQEHELPYPTDLNKLLATFGVSSAPPGRAPEFGEVDYDLDLLRAHEAVRTARDAVAALPQETLDRLGGVDAVLRGVVNGTLTTLDPPPPPQPPVAKPGEATGAQGSQT